MNNLQSALKGLKQTQEKSKISNFESMYQAFKSQKEKVLIFYGGEGGEKYQIDQFTKELLLKVKDLSAQYKKYPLYISGDWGN